MKKLAALITRIEGGRSQAKMGDVEQVLKILAVLAEVAAIEDLSPTVIKTEKAFKDFLKYAEKQAAKVKLGTRRGYSADEIIKTQCKPRVRGKRKNE